MALLTIVKEGDDILRKKCREVDVITPRIKTLIEDMIETLHEAQGAGLAAPQVGVLKRIALVETEPGETIVLINPKIVAYYGEQEELEGCLSILLFIIYWTGSCQPLPIRLSPISFPCA